MKNQKPERKWKRAGRLLIQIAAVICFVGGMGVLISAAQSGRMQIEAAIANLDFGGGGDVAVRQSETFEESEAQAGQSKESRAQAEQSEKSKAQEGQPEAGQPKESETQAGKPEESGMQTGQPKESRAQEGPPEARQPEESEARTEKLVALTFDDGPHPVYTPRLLDGLKARGIPATFFVVGKNIPGNEDLIRRMSEEGHLIGNHTYDHVKISDMKDADACAQVQKTSGLVKEITGKDTEFVRPPFGSWNKELECPIQMIPVLWNVDPLDWTTKNKALVVQRVLKEVRPGDIILLHDFYESSVEAALEIADALLADGYTFVTVETLILE